VSPRSAVLTLAALLLSMGVLAGGPGSSVAAPTTSTLRVTMYQATLQRSGDRLEVKEAYSFENPHTTEWTPPDGGLSFSLPAGLEDQPVVTVNTADGRRELSLTADPEAPGRWILPGALPAGRTSVTIGYSLAYPGQTVFAPRFFYPVDGLRLYVRPDDMQVEGRGVHRQEASVMPGFATYLLDPVAEPSTLELHLSGGLGQASSPTPQTHVALPQPKEEWHIEIRPNRFSQRRARLLLFTILTALLALALVYGNSRAAGIGEQIRADGRRRSELLRLEDRFVTGHLSREAFIARRDEILSGEQGRRKRRPRTGKSARKA